jgi:hypothetical protein
MIFEALTRHLLGLMSYNLKALGLFFTLKMRLDNSTQMTSFTTVVTIFFLENVHYASEI